MQRAISLQIAGRKRRSKLASENLFGKRFKSIACSCIKDWRAYKRPSCQSQCTHGHTHAKTTIGLAPQVFARAYLSLRDTHSHANSIVFAFFRTTRCRLTAPQTVISTATEKLRTVIFHEMSARCRNESRFPPRNVPVRSRMTIFVRAQPACTDVPGLTHFLHSETKQCSKNENHLDPLCFNVCLLVIVLLHSLWFRLRP